MVIGVFKEIKANENRVALTPAAAQALINAGHRVLVEAGAGAASGFPDAQFQQVGAEIVADRGELAAAADLILKVKEPLPEEYELFRPGHVLFTYLHLAAAESLTHELLKREVTAIAYETVQLPDRSLPLLTPMSEVAGRMATQIGSRFLEKEQGGKGVLLSGVPGVAPGEVVVLGGGVVGMNAARIAMGMGAQVTVIDINIERLRYLDEQFGARLRTLASNPYNIATAVRRADLLIGAVLIPGARAPQLVTEEMVREMEPGSVIIDVAIDQGGVIATSDRVTTHADPTYIKHGVVHYAVSNMPGAVPHTATIALTNATLPYVLQLAGLGWREAMRRNAALAAGLNTANGHVTHQAVADAFGLPSTPVQSLL